jgi:hypothetical protein
LYASCSLLPAQLQTTTSQTVQQQLVAQKLLLQQMLVPTQCTQMQQQAPQ